MQRKMTLAMLLAATLALGACSFTEGNTRYVNPATLGEELIDLKNAYDQGAIDEEEYRRLKRQIMQPERPRRSHDKH